MSDTSLVARMLPFTGSVFSEYSTIAVQRGAVNLGQGFPDVDGPEILKERAIAAIVDGSGNQYPPRHGLPDLLEAVAEHQQRFYGLEYDPATEVVTGTGASELITASLLALVEPGDEVIVPEPWFDVYGAGIALAHGMHVSVPLAFDGEFHLDLDAIEAAITPRTRLILINTPHNPTGAVFNEAELTGLAALVERHNLWVISDEVYEHIVFRPRRHIPTAAIAGMRDRTITIGSGGKSFSMTGWKVGWATGPAHLISAVRVVRQHLSYVSSGPFQPAIATGLRLPDDYFTDLAARFQTSRDLLTKGLTDLGLTVLPSDGTYFLLTDVGERWPNGTACVNELIEHGVVAIPVSRLTTTELGDPYVRWTFCKRPEVISAALDRLQNL